MLCYDRCRHLHEPGAPPSFCHLAILSTRCVKTKQNHGESMGFCLEHGTTEMPPSVERPVACGCFAFSLIHQGDVCVCPGLASLFWSVGCMLGRLSVVDVLDMDGIRFSTRNQMVGLYVLYSVRTVTDGLLDEMTNKTQVRQTRTNSRTVLQAIMPN
jgi:hypothetical protein